MTRGVPFLVAVVLVGSASPALAQKGGSIGFGDDEQLEPKGTVSIIASGTAVSKKTPRTDADAKKVLAEPLSGTQAKGELDMIGLRETIRGALNYAFVQSLDLRRSAFVQGHDKGEKRQAALDRHLAAFKVGVALHKGTLVFTDAQRKAPPKPELSDEVKKALATRVTITVEHMPVTQVMALLAKETKLPLAADRRLEARITLELTDAPLDYVLEIVALVADGKLVKSGKDTVLKPR